MTKIISRVVCILFLMFSFTSFSQDVNVKHSGNFVTDNEDLFSTSQELEINTLISDYEKQTTVEIRVLTTDDFESESDASSYATWVHREWGVGKADLDNGLMLVLSKANGNDWGFSTGYGLEGYLPDLYLQQLRDTMTIIIDNGNYHGAVMWYLTTCMTELGDEYSAETNEEKINEERNELVVWFLGLPLWMQIVIGVVLIVGWLILFLK